MSQEKVNAYKAAKKTRKEDLAKEKRKNLILRIAGWVVAALLVCALVVGIVISVKNGSTKVTASAENFVNTSFDLPDLSGISNTDPAE